MGCKQLYELQSYNKIKDWFEEDTENIEQKNSENLQKLCILCRVFWHDLVETPAVASGQTSESDIWQLSLYETSEDGSGSSLANTVVIGHLSREMLFFVVGEEGIITWAVDLPKEKWSKS